METATAVESTLTVRELRDIRDLDSISDAWRSWPGNRDSELESYLEFAQANKATIRPHIIVVDRDGRPDTIFVGRIDRGHISCRIGYLRFDLPARLLVFVYGALRGSNAPENCSLIVDSVLGTLASGEVDAAYMNFLREGSTLCTLARGNPSALSRDHLRITQQHFAASLPATIEEFHRGLSPKVRKNQRYQAKKLEEQFAGDVTVRCFRDESEIEILAEEAERLASMSYQRGLGAGFRDSAAARSQLRLKAQRGWLRGYVLYLGGKAAAFWMGDLNEGTFGSDYLAYDPAYAKLSPGMYLITRVMEGFCDGRRDGVKAIDFGPGHAQYKEVLSTDEWHETLVYIFAPTIKGTCLNLVRTAIGSVDQSLKKLLSQTGLLNKVKKAWRTRAASKTAARG